VLTKINKNKTSSFFFVICLSDLDTKFFDPRVVRPKFPGIPGIAY
jgi:hypothetical protein